MWIAVVAPPVVMIKPETVKANASYSRAAALSETVAWVCLWGILRSAEWAMTVPRLGCWAPHRGSE